MMKPTVIVFLATLLASLQSLHAYSYIAGNCSVGSDGTGIQHGLGVSPTYNTKVTKGPLATGNFVVTIDGKPLNTAAKFLLTSRVSHTIALKGSKKGVIFKGFSIRLGINNKTSLVAKKNDALVTLNPWCSTFKSVGVCHTSNTTKTNVTALMNVPKATDNVGLDVTVVVQNSKKLSIFYYSGFKLKFT